MENHTPPTQAELDEWKAHPFFKLQRLITEVERLRAAAGFCEKHQPTGGHRNCLVCGCEKLTFALDRISYALGEKSEMGIRDYSLSYDEDKVVEKVARLTKEVEELRKDQERLQGILAVTEMIAELSCKAVREAAMAGPNTLSRVTRKWRMPDSDAEHTGSGPLGGMQETWWKDPIGKFATRPDYPNDLNAMHEAENTMSDGIHMEFERNLRRICSGRNYRHVISATARQRAIAFIKTVCPEKWKGNE